MWCTYLPHLVHLLTFLSLLGYVSPLRVSPLCYGSFVAASEFGWANGVFWQCTRGLCEELWHGCGAHTCPILCTCKPSFLSWVMSPRHVFPSRVMVPLSQPVSLVGQMAFFGNACEGCVRSCCMSCGAHTCHIMCTC